ncbi:lysozyme inhibitor LprI family protein [Scytonema sp. NUACC21]
MPIKAQEAVAQKINCSKAVTTPELKYCSQLSYQTADRRLNEVYKKVTSNLLKEQKQILTAAQQAWIKFRDGNCNFETYSSRDGTGYEIFRNGCLERLTKQRTKDLEDFLSR